MKKRGDKRRTPPGGTFLGRRLLALDALLERLIFLALPSVLFQGLFSKRRDQKTKEEKNRVVRTQTSRHPPNRHLDIYVLYVLCWCVHVSV